MIGLWKPVKRRFVCDFFAAPFAAGFDEHIVESATFKRVAAVGHIAPVRQILDHHTVVVAWTEQVVGEGELGFGSDEETASVTW